MPHLVFRRLTVPNALSYSAIIFITAMQVDDDGLPGINGLVVFNPLDINGFIGFVGSNVAAVDPVADVVKLFFTSSPK
jgi:hypothetical protein